MSQPNGEIKLTENYGTLTSGGVVGTGRDFGVAAWDFGHGFLTTMTSILQGLSLAYPTKQLKITTASDAEAFQNYVVLSYGWPCF